MSVECYGVLTGGWHMVGHLLPPPHHSVNDHPIIFQAGLFGHFNEAATSLFLGVYLRGWIKRVNYWYLNKRMGCGWKLFIQLTQCNV